MMARRRLRRGASLALLTALAPSLGGAQPGCQWPQPTQIVLEQRWVSVDTGRDEDRQRLRVAVWGTERIRLECAQIDDDPAPELIIVSRSAGSGPYYRAQIVDLHADGIQTWSYPSAGRPRVESGRVLLGVLDAGYGGAASAARYVAYRLTASGLVPQ